jgi:hypothetical protein
MRLFLFNGYVICHCERSVAITRLQSSHTQFAIASSFLFVMTSRADINPSY